MRRTVAAIVAVCLAACGAAAQDSSPRFQSGVDLVALNVVATDSKGKIVGGLASTEFAVFEDGHPQEISLFAVVPAPIDLALLLDTSASMTDKIGTVQQAAVGFTSVIRPTDRISIVEIKDAIRILHPLDNDVAAARKAIKSTVPRGNTSLYNGVYLTLREMQKQRRTDTEIRRQAIVLFSDGDDTTSLVAFDDLLELAKHAGVAIYTISLRTSMYPTHLLFRDPKAEAESSYAMRALAVETGARAFFPTVIQELGGVYDMIANELANQYLVGYIPKNPQRDGSYRRISIRVERPGIQARTRSGYFATPSSTSASR